MSLKRFFQNIRLLYTCNLGGMVNAITRLQKSDLCTQILHYYVGDGNEYEEELKYLRKNGLSIFPYSRLKRMKDVKCGIDKKLGMPYVLHQGRKLFFPKTYSVSQVRDVYCNFVENENVLGGWYREKSPHQYQSDKCRVEQGDVLIDMGCAEGLFALDTIEKVKKVYLVEADETWKASLEATFYPWRDKVIIVNDRANLLSILQEEKNEHLFVKMDIEGCECEVLEEAMHTLKQRDDIKFACCTYHRAGDAKWMEDYFKKLGYKYEFSEGYMLYVYDNLEAPFFRKGIIRAWKR